MLVYSQDGERSRPEQDYPLRLLAVENASIDAKTLVELKMPNRHGATDASPRSFAPCRYPA